MTQYDPINAIPTTPLTPAQASHVAKTHFSVAGKVAALDSEAAQNFRLETKLGETYVLKVAGDNIPAEYFDLEHRAMLHLRAKLGGNICPEPLPASDGTFTVLLPEFGGIARLISFLPGNHFADARPKTSVLDTSFGEMLGRVVSALADFDHPAAHRPHLWDLAHASQTVRERLDVVHDSVLRTEIQTALDQYRQHTLSHLPELRQSVIQNDANDYNVFVQREGWMPRVTGIIDFGDMMYTHTINELAIGMAYALFGAEDLLACARAVVSGFHEQFSLQEVEIAALYDLIRMRLCTSLVMAAERAIAGHDDPYLQISVRDAQTALSRWNAIPRNLVHYAFRHACGWEPVPHAPTVRDWLSTHADAFTSIVPLDLRREPLLILNQHPGSDFFGDIPDTSDAGQFTRVLFDQMRAHGARAAIGRYNEDRPIYRAPFFEVETGEWRSVHVAIDVFMPVGTPVFAPLEGVVHAFADNVGDGDYGPTIILRHDADGTPFYTLYGHLSRDSLDGLAVGQSIAAGQEIARMGAPEVNGNWAPHVHFQIITDLLDEETTFAGVALPSAREIRKSISPDPNLILQIPNLYPAQPRENAAILTTRAQHLNPNLSLSYREPIQMVWGRGVFLYDQHAQPYLDCVNNVAHVGHGHPRVTDAVRKHVNLLNTNTRYLHENIVRYAERLTTTLPASLSVCYFVNSGSEANDLALRLARTYTGQQDVIVLDGAYHGHLTSLIEISPYKFEGKGGAGAPPTTHVTTMPDPYRGPSADAAPYLDTLDQILEGLAARGPAAFIAESALGCGGQVILPDEYLSGAFARIRAAGGVCMADEVQVGFGRVGSHFWAFETQDVVPDIVTMGKPIGNGHPLAAVVTTPEIAAAFHNGMEYFNTFGGNPVSCAAGLAVLDVIEDEGLQENARGVGDYLLARLRELQRHHPIIGDVRGLGLFIGVELVRDRDTLEPAADEADYVVNRMRQHRILLSTDGPLHNVIKIKPPIVFSRENADLLVRRLDQVMGEVMG